MSTSRKLRASYARKFPRKLDGYSNMNHQKGIDWSDSIELLRKRFEEIPLKFRDPRIEKALREVEAAPPSRQYFIEYMIANYRIGFHGPEVSQDIMCKTICRVTHTKRFGVRTLRDSAQWAADHGFITKGWVPIGKRIFIKEKGGYRTKRIRQYTSTHKIRLLASIKKIDPKKYEAPEPVLIADNFQDCIQKPTLEKSASNPNGEQSVGDSKESPTLMLSRHCQNDDLKEQACDQRSQGSEVLPPSVGNVTTKPAQSGPTVEHPSSTNSNAAPRRRKRPKSKAVRFGRRNRTSTPTTYRNARKQFLKDLWIYLKPDTDGALQNASDLYRIAELQTEPFYPQFLPTALNWYDRMISMYIESWHERRRIVSRIVVPALRAFANEWTPPEKTQDPGYQKNFDVWERSTCPEPGIAVSPNHLSEYFRLWPYVRAMLSGMHAGCMKFEIEMLQSPKSAIFQFCRLFFC